MSDPPLSTTFLIRDMEYSGRKLRVEGSSPAAAVGAGWGVPYWPGIGPICEAPCLAARMMSACTSINMYMYVCIFERG